MTYEEQRIVMDTFSAIVIAILFFVTFGLLSVGSVSGSVGAGVIVMIFRLWYEKRMTTRK